MHHRRAVHAGGAAILLALAACASSPPASDPEDATDAVAQVSARDEPPRAAATARGAYVTASELAEVLGLELSGGDEGEPVALTAPDGGRILLFPGTSIASVAGARVDLAEAASESHDELVLTLADSISVRTAWMARAATSAEPVRASRVAPSASPPAAATAPSGRASQAERAAWSVKPALRDWRYIVIHHSATPTGSASVIDRWHRNLGWDGLGYHFVIGNGTDTPDGSVEVGFRWRRQREGAHAKTEGNVMNEHGIGICLVGDFNHEGPSPAQMRSLERLSRFLMEYCHLAGGSFRLHRDVKGTECPGRHFPRGFIGGLSSSRGRSAYDAGKGDLLAGSR